MRPAALCRCYDQWMDVLQCLSEGEDKPQKCKAFVEDYIECLHHRKEYARQLAIKQEMDRQKSQEQHKEGH